MSDIGAAKKKKEKFKKEVTEQKKASTSDQIVELEKEISNTKYNKRTQHAIGLLKAKLAKLKEKAEQRQTKKGGGDKGYSVRKTGDGTVILIGFPSVGKSSLLNVLTEKESEVGAYAFTTLSVVPGTLEHKYAKIQILDVPGIVKGAAAGTGKGREVLAVTRSADLVILLLDVNALNHYPVLLKELRDTGLRVNERPPDVKIIKKEKGGISVGSTVKLTKITKETVKAILSEFKINNADVVIRTDIDMDQLIDVIESNKKYLPAITIINKADLASKEKLQKAMKKVNASLAVSTHTKSNIDELKELIFDKLDLIRIYCKEAGKKADLEEPLIMFRNCTIKDMCEKLHKDFVSKFKFSRIWGKSAKFDGQKVMMKHRLKDGDIVEIHLR